ncbi:MAG: hypothetical protein KC445_01340 [Anaerolineales bacterium]|nr:hypothetical protein [Anaerolineales bacterium]
MKKYLSITLLLMLIILLAACGGKDTVQEEVPSQDENVGQATEVPQSEEAAAVGEVSEADAGMSEVSARGFIEPPFLADRVAAGELPPIDERLPEEVFVVGPGVLLQEEYGTWEDGQYGGDLVMATSWGSGNLNIAGGATILRSPSQNTAESVPNVVASVDISDDYTTYTFGMRKGLRWSDGEPVTTEDVRFTFEDIYNDPDVQRGLPTELYTQGNSALGAAELTIIDEYTFELKFSKPYGAFVAALNSWIPYYDILIKPSHYLKQFHASYADANALASAMADANVDNWVNLLNTKDASHWDLGEMRALGQPTLNAWVLTEATDDRRIFERNPYYWHVDSNGRQLPYIDRVVNNMTIDSQATLNAIVAGNVTVAGGNSVAISDMPLILKSADEQGRNVFFTGSFNSPTMLFLNHDFEYDVEGSVWQTLIADPEQRFGKAIAAAMDPVEINDTVFFGRYGEPYGNNTGHDLDKANQLLDELGFEMGSDGWRLGPDGKPFLFVISFNNESTETAPVAELLKEQIEEAGIQVELEVNDVALWEQRKSANELMASLKWNDGPGWPSGISEDYLPNHKGPWSPMTWLYYTTNGEEGREPPAYIQEFYDLHTARKEFPPESSEGAAIFDEMLQWMWDYHVMIPVTGPVLKPSSVDGNLRNVPNDGAPFDLDVIINYEGYWFATE